MKMLEKLLCRGSQKARGLIGYADIIEMFPDLGPNKPLLKVTVAVATILVGT